VGCRTALETMREKWDIAVKLLREQGHTVVVVGGEKGFRFDVDASMRLTPEQMVGLADGDYTLEELVNSLRQGAE
jgi:hypothetical protein